MLHYYLLRRLRHRPEDTADLTQEIFERFLRKKDRPEMIRNPLAYLYGIASNVVAETIEQEPFQLVTFNSKLADHITKDATFAATDDFARQMGMREDIVEALGKLPEAQLTALLLVEGDGMSCKEAARATGYSANTIKQYLCHARATMKRLLEDYWSREDGHK